VLLAWRIERGGETMLLIDCPWCGARDDAEFHYGGEAHIARPLTAHKLSDAQWVDYLFLNTNTRGPYLERWQHSHGCRRWFNMARDTVTHEVIEIYPMGELPKSKAGIKVYEDSWRRQSAAELNAKAAPSSDGESA
jgi:sarcosine oxidase subunit delta